MQWTPYGMGRRAGAPAGPAEKSGVNVVAATGLHQTAHYDRALLDGVRDRLAAPIGVHLELGTAALDDTTTAGARAVMGGPGMPYLLRRLRPALRRELGEETANRLFVTNPARAFQVEW